MGIGEKNNKHFEVNLLRKFVLLGYWLNLIDPFCQFFSYDFLLKTPVALIHFSSIIVPVLYTMYRTGFNNIFGPARKCWSGPRAPSHTVQCSRNALPAFRNTSRGPRNILMIKREAFIKIWQNHGKKILIILWSKKWSSIDPPKL